MSATQITNRDALVEGLVWALLTYKDGSQFCFQTTLNSDILRERGIVLEEGKLARLDKKYYWGGQYIYRQFNYVGAKVSLWTGLHYEHMDSLKVHDFL